MSQMKLDQAVGQRIAKAREFLGLTQATVAERMGMARTTQVAIEQGQRPVSVAELYRYGEILSRPLDYFFGLGVWQEETGFRPYFRQMAERLDAVHVGPPRRPGRPRGAAEASLEKLALMKFEALCRNYLELERVNGLPVTTMPELPTPRRFSAQEAEHLAGTLRAHLDMGNDAPIRDLRVRLEDAFGIRVFVLAETGRLSAAAFHHDKVGGSVLLADQSVPRMRFALARALGHLLANREEAMVDVQDVPKKSAIEQFAAAFAASFLMPARGLRERFGAVHSEANDANEVALLYLARMFGVSLGPLCARLQSLRLVSASTLKRIGDALRDARGPAQTSVKAAAAAGQGLPDQTRWDTFPERYVFLAIRAYRKGLVNRSRFAECLLTSEDDSALRVLLYVSSVADRHDEDAAKGATRAS
jgi:Zn-dependent peptidase ImmA (M78 family)/transcriptional regulator with XRE-family HTH domain